MSDPVESKLRARLPFIRFMQSYMPLPAVRLAAQTRHEKRAPGRGCDARSDLRGWCAMRMDHSPGQPPGQVLLYLHGGGFVYGLSPPHLQMGAYLAQKMGLRMLVVDYRLAPDHPFPAALDDCVTVYRWLLKQGFLAQNIVIAGDLAGGNLTITSLMKLRDSGIPLPAAAACLSPVTDLTEKAIIKDLKIRCCLPGY